MCHAARLPPPPIFDDRRLVQLIAFRKLQIIDERFGVCVFCLRLNLACFCRYLHVLDVCCQFASCRATLAICKFYCKTASEMHQQLGTHLSKSIPNPSKVDQSDAQERSKSDIGSKSIPGMRFWSMGRSFLEAVWRQFFRKLNEDGTKFHRKS